VGNVALTAFVDVDSTRVTLETLSVEAIEEGTAVAAERETFVVVDFEPVGHVDAEPSLPGQLLVVLLLF
jgi:hypothetical protein